MCNDAVDMLGFISFFCVRLGLEIEAWRDSRLCSPGKGNVSPHMLASPLGLSCRSKALTKRRDSVRREKAIRSERLSSRNWAEVTGVKVRGSDWTERARARFSLRIRSCSLAFATRSFTVGSQ